MLDFLMISTRSVKRGVTDIYPKFIIRKSEDLMIRGGDFYAIWLEDKGMWSTDEQDALQLIDKEIDAYAEKKKGEIEGSVRVLHMWDAGSGMIDAWHKYCQKQMRDSFHMLDERLIFSNTEVTKKDYASKRLPYPLNEGSIEAYDKLMSVLYSPEERRKIEWAVGAIVNGDSVKIQKFLVLYGAPKTGKSTILNIIQKLFEGYYSVFDAKSLGSSNNSFALEAFKTNPLVAIQHDGDLSHIEDNTRLNSLVAHEMMTVNEKFKSAYASRFKTFLFMGTNKPVKITDGRSGLIRRLIDVSPSGNKLPRSEYDRLYSRISFELGAIAYHCKQVYESNPHYYDDYVPTTMLGASNDFYNFVEDRYFQFKDEDAVTLTRAYEMYKTYCEEAKVLYPVSRRVFQEELKVYFKDFKDRAMNADGVRVRSYYTGFKTDIFGERDEKPPDSEPKRKNWLEFKAQDSIFDRDMKDCIAQYASEKETPLKKWENVKTTLYSLDTSRLHYVRVPSNHIVIDFDIKDETGKKSFSKNLEAAMKWSPTYAELSKSGEGIHLHYIYDGDPNRLSRVFDDSIEVKVFTGNSSLRRMLTKCNDIPIAHINSGLPLKGEKMVNFDSIKNEKGLRTIIRRNLNREYHANTKPSVDFIFKVLEDAYESGMKYDVSDMYNAVLNFAMQSTNQADTCLKLVNKMHFKSDDPSESIAQAYDSGSLIFYDVEVFPNLFLVNWKFEGEGKSVVRMFNPSPEQIEELLKFKLVGFNCRRYDNHMLYARLMGYTNEQLYKLSQRIISGDRNAFFGEAYNLSYTDVYDFSSVKQSLKKFEIELGQIHKELGLPWDQPVPEELWVTVAEYCDNDVISTEAVFNARKADFTARCVLADLAGMTVNDTTNSLTTRIIFGKERKPQSEFNYRNLAGNPNESVDIGWSGGFVYETGTRGPGITDITPEEMYPSILLDPNYTQFQDGKPIFPGYSFENGRSMYRGEEVGEGGYVYAEPGIYTDVALLDIASMHPSSIVAEELFGPRYTKRFQDILEARIAIKHKDFEKAKSMLDGKLAKYLTDENAAKDLAQALKIAINSVYGLTAANFDNPFRDIRNRDNIVAKRGALFMVNLKHEVQRMGFTVAHIKTDSIKIPNATPEIIQFVTEYGKRYGYNFEHEATYEKMCLVNDAVYIAKYKDSGWTATGTQFQVPYVFKTLFSHEPIEFSDLCETKQVSSALYLDLNEGLPDVSAYEKELAKVDRNDISAIEELEAKIAEGHDYHFVGKVGSFSPVVSGAGGGWLVRHNTSANAKNKYSAVTGTKDYRWLESETVKLRGLEDKIDRSYYNKFVDAAAEAISKYGDLEWFIS